MRGTALLRRVCCGRVAIIELSACVRARASQYANQPEGLGSADYRMQCLVGGIVSGSQVGLKHQKLQPV